VSNANPAPGDTVTLQVSGFLADESVTATLHSDPVVLGSTVAPGGAVELTVTVPADVEPGEHDLVVTGAVSGAGTSTPIEVQGEVEVADGAATLPATGAAAWPLGLAVLSLLAGTGVVARSRRRTWT
jgi:LPXTG-motif cell wall-anchored protein